MNARRVPLFAALAVLGALAAVPAGAEDADGGAWVLVEFAEPVRASQRAALQATGVEGVQYTPDNSYVAFATRAQARTAGAILGVARVRPVTPDEKVEASLAAAVGVTSVAVTAHASTGAAVESWIERLGVPAHRYADDPRAQVETIEARLPIALVADLARLPGVLDIGVGPEPFALEDEASAQILAGNVTNSTTGVRPVPGYEAFLAARGITGEGVTISIADTGIKKTHPEFEGRVAREIWYSAPQDTDVGGHGTHVAGIVGGKGAEVPSLGRVQDPDGFLLGLGVAPKVTFVNQAVIPSGRFPNGAPNDFGPLTRDALQAGAVGWNASWNTGGAGTGYVARARSLDISARDGDAETVGNQPFTMVFSAGNSGSGAQTITQPKEAKNIITVGSAQSHRVLPPGANGIDTISSFSSRGPAKDGRILPTVVAPGQDIVSATSAPTASCGAPTSAGGIVPFAVSATYYSTCSGTSMAAPHVTGTVALLTQWWRELSDGADPSPALAKALLVNTATDLGARDVPNNNEGWGRVNLANLFDADAERVYVDQEVVFDDLEQAWDVEVERADPAKPLRVTLVWTDAAARANALKTLVNDLDLRVEDADGTVWLGNVFAGGGSAAGGAPDRRNNVESVFLDTAPAERYRVVVEAVNLPGDGVPGNDAWVDQDFALVVSNARVAD